MNGCSPFGNRSSTLSYVLRILFKERVPRGHRAALMVYVCVGAGRPSSDFSFGKGEEKLIMVFDFSFPDLEITAPTPPAIIQIITLLCFIVLHYHCKGRKNYKTEVKYL